MLEGLYKDVFMFYETEPSSVVILAWLLGSLILHIIPGLAKWMFYYCQQHVVVSGKGLIQTKVDTKMTVLYTATETHLLLIPLYMYLFAYLCVKIYLVKGIIWKSVAHCHFYYGTIETVRSSFWVIRLINKSKVYVVRVCLPLLGCKQ